MTESQTTESRDWTVTDLFLLADKEKSYVRVEGFTDGRPAIVRVGDKAWQWDIQSGSWQEISAP